MDKIERFQAALAEFSAATKEITGATITHIYVDDHIPMVPKGASPFRLVLEGIKINQGRAGKPERN